jgi:hypothetical protein
MGHRTLWVDHFQRYNESCDIPAESAGQPATDLVLKFLPPALGRAVLCPRGSSLWR